MESWMNKWQTWVIAALVGIVAIWYLSGGARAADLGGNCCADLEERIAELEATVARKGNRKVSLTISGRISKAIVWTDVEDYNDYSVGENSNAPSYFALAGKARISSEWSASYVLEVGVGGYEAIPGYGHIEGDTNGIYLRKSYVQLKSEKLGGVSLGKASQATDGITQADLSNSWKASTPLSFRPLTGPGVGEVLEIFDGTRANVVRYDSPVLAGFQLSGSAAAANFDSGGATDGTVWDVALKWASDFGGKEFKAAAAIGYREGIVIEDDALFGIPLAVAIADNPKVWSGSGSVMHVPTGIFAAGSYGNADFGPFTVKGYAGKLGVEQKLFANSGKTTIYGEYGKWDLPGMAPDLDYYGAGIVQAIDAAAMSLYVSGRKYDLLGTDATVIMGGAMVDF